MQHHEHTYNLAGIYISSDVHLKQQDKQNSKINKLLQNLAQGWFNPSNYYY
jgi:hypothetical protein